MKTKDGLPVVTYETLDGFMNDLKEGTVNSKIALDTLMLENVGIPASCSGISSLFPLMESEVCFILLGTYELLRRQAASDISIDRVQTINSYFETTEGMPKISLSTVDVAKRDIERYIPAGEKENLFKIIQEENPVVAQFIEKNIEEMDCFKDENNARTIRVLIGGLYELLSSQARTNNLRKQMPLS